MHRSRRWGKLAKQITLGGCGDFGGPKVLNAIRRIYSKCQQSGCRNFCIRVRRLKHLGWSDMAHRRRRLSDFLRVTNRNCFALGVHGSFQLVFPYTFMFEVSNDQLRYGQISPIDSTVVIHHREIARAIIDADAGHVWVEDSRGKMHLISGDLSISRKDFMEIKSLFERFISPERLIFRPFIGTEVYPASSRIPE